MTGLGDATVAHLRSLMTEPDLGGTRYRLLGVAGRGGMGTVYEVEDTVLRRLVALKVLDLAGDGLERRLAREAEVLARLEHPGIVPVHDAGTLPDGRAYYAMKLVRGVRLDRAASGLAPTERLRIFLRVAEAVAFAHVQGVVHRDLKPQNVMLGSFGEVLVLDWGIAKVLGGGQTPAESGAGRSLSRAGEGVHTGSGTVLGTPGYMAPEQGSGSGFPVDVRADVYGLGAMLRFLFDPGSAPGAPGAARALQAIWQRAMAEAPADRYPDVPALAVDVERFLAGEPVSAYREGWMERAGRLVRRHHVALLLVATYLFARAALLLFRRG
jgi:eukaryotic-like serine/threonine-protein kinase